MTSNEFSKFFEEPNTNIVIETQEQLEDIQNRIETLEKAQTQESKDK